MLSHKCEEQENVYPKKRCLHRVSSINHLFSCWLQATQIKLNGVFDRDRDYMVDIKVLLIALMLMLSVVVFVAAQGIISPQTASVQIGNYSALAADSGKMIVMNCATNCALTLPSTIPSPNWGVW